MPIRLVLWDVDHTLLELHGLHYHLYAKSLPAAFGRKSVRLPDMTGRTDRDSSREYLEMHGVEPSDDNLTRFWAALIEQFDAVQPEIVRWGGPTDGALETVGALAQLSDLYQSVLTGNLRVLAERKLAAFGLDRYLDFDIGGYGEDSEIRAELVGRARTRLDAKHHKTVDLAHTVLIGDSPLDIEAAYGSGARIVAVATGKSRYDALVDAGADAVLVDLTEPRATLAAIERATAAQLTNPVTPAG